LRNIRHQIGWNGSDLPFGWAPLQAMLHPLQSTPSLRIPHEQQDAQQISAALWQRTDACKCISRLSRTKLATHCKEGISFDKKIQTPQCERLQQGPLLPRKP